jgi:hypothetical protein
MLLGCNGPVKGFQWGAGVGVPGRSSARRPWCLQEALVVQYVLALYLLQLLVAVTQPQQKALGFLAVAAQGGGAVDELAQPQQYGLLVGLGGDQLRAWRQGGKGVGHGALILEAGCDGDKAFTCLHGLMGLLVVA